jgi:tetratricopeptide (TPR) repeat protein
MGRRVLDVFLSSTAEDLKPFRAEVHKRLMSKGIFHCVRQEDFGAQDSGAVEYCRKQAQAADIFVGLIGLRRGWEPDGDAVQRSITEMEHDWARKAGVRRYLWVAPHDFPVAGHIRETDALHARQQAFRAKVMANGERIVSQAGFGSPELLAADVVDRLLIEVVTSDLIRELRPELSDRGGSTAEDQRPAIAAAVEKLAEDKDVDLLALAKNPKCVDLAELEAKLKARAEKLGARSAEYWRHIGALAFRHDTQKSLAAYRKAVAFDPCDPEGWRYQGELQYRLGDLAAAEKSFTMLKELPEDRFRSIGCARLGWIYGVRGDLSAAEKIIREALSLAERAQWTEGEARAYRYLGNIYHTCGDLDRAEEMHLKALALNEALGHKESVAKAYGHLGLIHQMRGDLRRAEQAQRKALELDEALGLKAGVARAYGNIGVIYETRGDLDRAEKMQLKALALNEALGRREGVAKAYGDLGVIYRRRGELDQAEEIQLKGLALNEAIGRKIGVARAYANLAVIYHAREEHQRMRDCGCKARDLWRVMGLNQEAAKVEQWLREVDCDKA